MQPDDVQSSSLIQEKLLKSLRRQLRVVSGLLMFFGIIILLSLAVAGYFAWRAYSDVKKAETNITNLVPGNGNNQSLQTQLCSGNGSLAKLVKQQTSVCN